MVCTLYKPPKSFPWFDDWVAMCFSKKILHTLGNVTSPCNLPSSMPRSELRVGLAMWCTPILTEKTQISRIPWVKLSGRAQLGRKENFHLKTQRLEARNDLEGILGIQRLVFGGVNGTRCGASRWRSPLPQRGENYGAMIDQYMGVVPSTFEVVYIYIYNKPC